MRAGPYSVKVAAPRKPKVHPMLQSPMRELESTAASRARGFPVLAAPLHNARPGAPRVAAIPSLVLAQQMRAAQQG
jgi:hypothetical protein